MKKIFIYSLILAILLPVTLFAGTVHFDRDYSLRKGEEVVNDLYVAGNSTTIAGNVLGDLLATGLNVFVGGNTISNDALIIGGTVNVVSDIGEDLRLVAGKALFSGTVGEDLAVAAQEIQTISQSKVSGSFIAAAGRVVLGGEVVGDVKIAAGEVIINDVIGGNVSITADKVVIGPEARISGNLNYASGHVAEISDGAEIRGETVYKAINTRPGKEKFLPTLWGTWVLIQFVVLMIAALVLHGVFRNISHRFVATSINSFWRSLLYGFLFAVAVPIALVLAFATFVGIPFGILGVAIYSIFLIIASIYGPIVLGALIYKITKRQKEITVSYKTVVIGVVATIVLNFIPYIGDIIKYAFIVVALGAIYRVLFDKFVEVR
jgi:cytoskeletal protein CcmA (bactofilin family)